MTLSLDHLPMLPRYVLKDTFQTVCDDKSGYDHILLSDASKGYFGFGMGGLIFVYKQQLPFWSEVIRVYLPSH